MSRVLVYLGRFALIIAGYAVASVAGSAFLNLLFLGSLDLTPDEAASAFPGSIVFSIPFVAIFVAYWLTAGRNAGSWRDRAAARIPPSGFTPS